jgi:hypothetical protein
MSEFPYYLDEGFERCFFLVRDADRDTAITWEHYKIRKTVNCFAMKIWIVLGRCVAETNQN